MALYADENFPLRVIQELRRLGQDVLTAFEDGRANQSISDPDILARATQLDRAIITLNRFDFKKLHVQMPEHAGIISALRIQIVLVRHGELLRQLPKPETSEQN